ncbi:MAG: glycosyltransferase family 4 protein [Tannerella sp.]|jgi:UDP-N-acetylmuramyl pentapeptide phosphotransferase/UDP-N-acetylglucosamine-1-phosphate transferase|nr:glycosyltransferase family 4 protein [Tannerella sp.]
MHLLFYPFIAAVLFLAMLFYIKIADRFNIIDCPNERSSHDYITVRGGGVIFWLAGLGCCLFHLPGSIYFLTGFTLISIVSFVDDVSSLPNRGRIIAHTLAISLLFLGFGLFQTLPWWMIIIAYILIVGTLNAYNFMDGINGITGLYSLVVLIALQYVNLRVIRFMPPDFINYAIIACIVFLFFNYRKRAKCFAGDVGSMAIAFWIVTLLLQLIIETESLIWVLFLTVYGVDSIFTILHRLYLRQNIFKAHRMHFYQVLTNELGLSHLKVAAGYAIVQFIICGIIIAAYIWFPNAMWFIGTGMLIICSLIYVLKFAILKKKIKTVLTPKSP